MLFLFMQGRNGKDGYNGEAGEDGATVRRSFFSQTLYICSSVAIVTIFFSSFIISFPSKIRCCLKESSYKLPFKLFQFQTFPILTNYGNEWNMKVTVFIDAWFSYNIIRITSGETQLICRLSM